MENNPKNLSKKEICDLRLKCLEMFVVTASKHNIEQDIVFEKAKKAWEYMIEAIADKEKG